jgi:hypothetical protein
MSQSTENIKQVDEIDLIDQIIEYIMDQRHPNGWRVEQIQGDERGPMIVDPQLEIEFSDLWYDIEQIISECEVSEPINGSMGILFTDLTAQGQERVLNHYGSTRDDLNEFRNGWILAWIPPQS